MNLLSLDVRLGLSGIANIAPEIEAFHTDVAQLLLADSDPSYTRIGLPHCTPLDHRQLVHDTRSLTTLLQSAFEEVSETRATDVCLLDFTNNPFVAVRDPLLLVLADGFEKLAAAEKCSRFILLLPQLPGPEAASIRRFIGSDSSPAQRPLSIVLLSNAGIQQEFDMAGHVALRTTNSEYVELLNRRIASPVVRAKRKCIQRLGHFRTVDAPIHETACRSYSFLIHDADQEFLELLTEWWTHNGRDARGIVFDLAHNSSLRNALKTFADQKRILAERVVDVVKNRQLGNQFAGLGECVLVLDVVGRGNALKHHVRELSGKGVRVRHEVLTGILKAGTTQAAIDGYRVHGFVSVSPEGSTSPCLQCQIGLPLVAEGFESASQIRTFDMLQMAEDCGWEPEPENEVPRDPATGYQTLPRFGRILEAHGRWLCYRLHLLLTESLFPDDWLLVHPDEADSGSLADLLAECFDAPPAVIRIPPSAIRKAEADGTWEEVLRSGSAEFWYQQLNRASGPNPPTALALDIFSGSGSTFRTMASLLKYFQIPVFAAACLVNFRPDIDISATTSIPLYRLYDWYNPRPSSNRIQHS